MIQKYFLLWALSAFSGLTCFGDCNLTAQKVKQKKPVIEGYIILDIKTLTDADGSDNLQKTLTGTDSVMLSGHRKMYLQNNCLIDIIENKNFHDGEYIKTDTLSYDFYDLVNQKYVLFEKLSTDAKIIKRGSMAIDGSFSNAAQYDLWNGVVDSTWTLTDTVINGKRQGVINFTLTGVTDSLDIEFIKKTKFWVDHEVKDFPLQLSYILSRKLNGAFVYKMQQSFPDGKTVMITSFDYQPVKLPASITRIFERWTQIARE